MTEADRAVIDETRAESEPQEALDQTPVMQLGRRDAAISLAALSLWAAADTWYATTGLGFAALVSLLNGAAVGYGLGLMAHEWGHFAGARWAGGVAPTRSITSVFPIFALDMQRSDERAFRSMSVGGNVGHWLVVALFAIAIPLDSVGRIALLAGSFAFAVSASTTEFPIIRRAYAGASPAESFRGLTRDKLRRNRWIGAAAGLVLFLGL